MLLNCSGISGTVSNLGRFDKNVKLMQNVPTRVKHQGVKSFGASVSHLKLFKQGAQAKAHQSKLSNSSYNVDEGGSYIREESGINAKDI